LPAPLNAAANIRQDSQFYGSFRSPANADLSPPQLFKQKPEAIKKRNMQIKKQFEKSSDSRYGGENNAKFFHTKNTGSACNGACAEYSVN
jgi:hypothetical protein